MTFRSSADRASSSRPSPSSSLSSQGASRRIRSTSLQPRHAAAARAPTSRTAGARAARRAERRREQQRRTPRRGPRARSESARRASGSAGSVARDAAREVRRVGGSSPWRADPGDCAHAADAHTTGGRRSSSGCVSWPAHRSPSCQRAAASPALAVPRRCWTRSRPRGQLLALPDAADPQEDHDELAVTSRFHISGVLCSSRSARSPHGRRPSRRSASSPIMATSARSRVPARRPTTQRPARTDRGLGREHLGRARRVPLRVAEDEGRLHPHRARTARRQGRGPAPQVRLDDPLLARLRRGARERRVHGDGLMSLQFRRDRRRPDRAGQSPIKGADVIQLERRGGRTSCPSRSTATRFPVVQTTDIPLGDDVYVGLYICAHNDTVTERATLSDVRITVPAKATFVPYREYIGSNVEIMEVATGRRRIVYRATGSVQAPNWTSDGKALIYNQDGKLYRFDLTTRHADADQHRHPHPQQQRPRALVRREVARHQRPERQREPQSVDGVRRAHRGWDAAARHAARSLVPARLVARREVSRLHRHPRHGDGHLPHPA